VVQDASEYFQYLLDLMSRSERVAGQGGRLGQASEPPTAASFEFGVETRVQCSQSGRSACSNGLCVNVLEREKYTASTDNSSSTQSSHLRLIGRGVPEISFEFSIVQFLCDLPLEEP